MSMCGVVAGQRSFAEPQDDNLRWRAEGLMAAGYLFAGVKEDGKMNGILPTTAGAGSTTGGDDEILVMAHDPREYDSQRMKDMWFSFNKVSTCQRSKRLRSFRLGGLSWRGRCT